MTLIKQKQLFYQLKDKTYVCITLDVSYTKLTQKLKFMIYDFES